MGVSGCGKSALSRALHEQLMAAGQPARWLEGDDFHPAANVEKMRQGQPLDDEDRAPWLAELNAQMRQALAQGESAVLACSALKARYRQVLREGIGHFVLIHPHGPFELIEARMKARQHKYMPASLLLSQFDTLEVPDDAISARHPREHRDPGRSAEGSVRSRCSGSLIRAPREAAAGRPRH